MRFWVLVLLMTVAAAARAGDPPERVQVADPYLELHTGPGRGYPIVDVAERGEWVEIIGRHTDWFKVVTPQGKPGWASRSQLERTSSVVGAQKTYRDVLVDDYLQRRLEFGFAFGTFESDPILTAFATVGQLMRIQRFDGSEAFVINSASPVRDAVGNIVGCAVAIQDITELRRVEEELHIASDMLELRVRERTAELASGNPRLSQEIEDRKQTANSLREALTIIKQLRTQLHEENIYLKEEIKLMSSHQDIVGNSEAIRSVLQQIEQVAPTDSTVLIQGETGTGKELLAHAIHNLNAPARDGS